ncbi:BTAD domain-containing putative transcriptional regulator [Polymorphospora sp. NPDC051019]|uniref:BTAD domain-containing putative transcriptional regulator n=1 Tax=Polymorphospora sp. NPDC051019 TaxID=3155725 RepID=UPI00342E6C01
MRLFKAIWDAIMVGMVLAGTPLVLVRVAGPPIVRLPDRQTVIAWIDEPLTEGFVAGSLAASAWTIWILLVAAAIARLAIGLSARRRWLAQLRLPAPMHSLAATLLGAAAVTTATPTLAHAGPVTATVGAEPDKATDLARHNPAPSQDTATERDNTAEHDTTVTVRRHDTLWRIAGTHLDDPNRWPEIHNLNKTRYQMRGGHHLQPGWVLALPTPPTSDQPAERPHVPTEPDTDQPPRNHHDDDVAEPDTTPSTPETTPDGTGTRDSPSTANRPGKPAVPDNTPPPTAPHQSALPAQGWISLGLAAAIAAVSALLRLQRRRRARLTFPTPASITPRPAPLSPSMARVNTIGSRHLDLDSSGRRPATPAVPAPIGVDAEAAEVSLFHLPGPGIALHGQGAIPAARAILAAVLTTNATETAALQPVVVTTTDLLTRLLPDDTPAVGLDPDGTAYDGERLVVLADTAAAITHAEEEMIGRRRLLDTFDAQTITDLNTRNDHAETQPPYVLLIESTNRHTARLQAIATHRATLDLHPVILGAQDDLPTVEISDAGTVTGDFPFPAAKLSTLNANDLADVLTMLTETLARPEPGTDVDDPPTETSPAAAPTETTEPVPARTADTTALVRLQVLGPVTVTTRTGPIATGMRSGSYTVLTVLAAHPAGRTLDQLTADLHPDIDPIVAAKRVRTDITTARRVLRTATGHDEPMFIVYDPATGRYHLDPATVTVDLWQMLTNINHAATTEDDEETLAALRRATDLYTGDFAEGHDHPWATDYATSYRHQILTAHARIAEILEPDHPDQAVAALERAADLDPVNEELHQRIMRIHGRQQRPDAVRRTLRRLEERLADLGDTEPSQATRRVAERQLRPVAPIIGARP